MKPQFWKLSMGKGTTNDFRDVLEVFDWLRQGVVLVHKDTRAPGTASVPQGTYFVQPERTGEYFYVCHGNNAPGIILLGQFSGPANVLSVRGDGWAERPFRWIRTAITTKHYDGQKKWWTPNADTTFIGVPESDVAMFEETILQPYFGLRLSDFRVSFDE
jgi:hypothetical protein